MHDPNAVNHFVYGKQNNITLRVDDLKSSHTVLQMSMMIKKIEREYTVILRLHQSKMHSLSFIFIFINDENCG